MSDTLAQAAPAQLGHTLLSRTLAHESTKPQSARTGCPSIDEAALGGGFRYGEMTSLAGGSETGKSLVWCPSFFSPLHQPVDHLRPNLDSRICWDLREIEHCPNPAHELTKEKPKLDSTSRRRAASSPTREKRGRSDRYDGIFLRAEAP